MTVEIQLDGTALTPQPRETTWQTPIVGGKMDGTEALGSYYTLTLRAPVGSGGTANWNWGNFANSVLTSIQAHAPYDTMKGSAVTYNSGVVARAVRTISTPPGGLVRGVEMDILIII